MQSKNVSYPFKNVILRDFRASDIDDEIFWFTGQHPWMDWDAPWEPVETPTRAELEAYLTAPKPTPRRRLEIEAEGVHIGFVSAYRIGADYDEPTDQELAAGTARTAVGIDILNDGFWGRGYGAAALAAWLRYRLDHGADDLYLQTWSGNTRMIRVAQKLGFVQCDCRPRLRLWQDKRWDALSFRLDREAFFAAITRIVPVSEANLDAAAEVHAAAWQASHAEICAPDFLAAHTAARQRDYLKKKMESGSRIFLLTEAVPAGLISVTGDLIEDLYVLPACQGQGFGTALLNRAIAECAGTPRLWLLETNLRARRFYEERGFRPTGNICRTHGPLAELEYRLGPDTGIEASENRRSTP